MIRKAEARDVDAAENIYTELLTYEKEKGGFSNWVLGVYPTRATAECAFEEDSLFVLEDEGEVCGCVILNQKQAEDYYKINWKYPAEDKDVLVIHTLCIPPSKSGKGYGRQMIDFAVSYAGEKGLKAVRIDTYAGNEPAKRLYMGMGFVLSGEAEVLHQGVIRERQVFLERSLSFSKSLADMMIEG